MQSRLLLLEDDELLRSELAEDLSDHYQVEAAANAEEAITMAKFSEFDLLISDVRMAGSLDGLGAVEQIKQLRPNIYTIIITGFTDEEAPSRAMRQGVDYYLFKPFGLKKLLNVIEMVLATQRDHSTYQGQMAQFLRGSRRFLAALTGQKLTSPATLDHRRYQFFKGLYAGIQSGNLTRNATLTLWDKLQPLEQEYEELMQVAGAEADALGHQYESLAREAERYAATRSMGDVRPRQPGMMVMGALSPLYDRVLNGELGIPLLMAGPVLWLKSRGQRPTESMGQLWDRLFTRAD